MKESIANSYLLMLMITFIIVIMTVFLSALAYSKAFKIKNKIIDLVEQYDDGFGYNPLTGGYTNKKYIEEDIENAFKDIGYRVNTGYTCPAITTKSGNKLYAINNQKNYRYCIYREVQSRGEQYHVITYMYFDIPIIDKLLVFPLSGQTKIFYETVDNHHKCTKDSDCGNKKCVNNKCI